ncbi:hypothetical protein [Halocalculus aciditolerans]|uniref:Uncharacterized protein n=1 Tax=Halocalculus aciditolerans TaxID=1383812 RepID=A0A830FEH7_9EURY|nr:hypothetical protein [Halocalculus aciditolerans]GGL67130.1 hypothetical protein GCM10009039_26410 [Halocalculus aciditolerans]
MLKPFEISERLQSRLESVEEQVTDAYESGTARSEDRVSGYLSGILSAELDDTFTSGSDEIRIDVDAFEGTNEPESGVDIGLRYQLVSEEFRLSTGMLIQSKRFGKSDPLLRHQCYKMLSRTQESYIFTYSPGEIGVVPALPVYCDGGTGGKYTRYYSNGFVEFLCKFLEGYHGDIRISDALDQPADAFPVPERVNYLIDMRVQVN